MTEQQFRLIPPGKWKERHDWPSEGALRNIIFHADTNGFAKCIRRINGRVLIIEHLFFECVNEQNEQPRRKRKKFKPEIIKRES